MGFHSREREEKILLIRPKKNEILLNIHKEREMKIKIFRPIDRINAKMND